MAVEAAPLVYTTQAEIEQIWTSSGVISRLDHDEDDLISSNETLTLTEIIIEATDTVNQYALNFYTDVALETSRWVRRRTSYIAAHLLSRVSGNAGQFIDEFNAAIADLERVMTGEFFIPRLATRKNFEPSISNQTVDYRHARDKLRTDPVTSTGGTDGTIQPLDYTPFSWWP